MGTVLNLVLLAVLPMRVLSVPWACLTLLLFAAVFLLSISGVEAAYEHTHAGGIIPEDTKTELYREWKTQYKELSGTQQDLLKTYLMNQFDFVGLVDDVCTFVVYKITGMAECLRYETNDACARIRTGFAPDAPAFSYSRLKWDITNPVLKHRYRWQVMGNLSCPCSDPDPESRLSEQLLELQASSQAASQFAMASAYRKVKKAGKIMASCMKEHCAASARRRLLSEDVMDTTHTQQEMLQARTNATERDDDLTALLQVADKSISEARWACG